MNRAFWISLCTFIFCANLCMAGPFGVGMGDKIDPYPKSLNLDRIMPDGRKCYIWKRPIIIKEVPGEFMLFFGKNGLSEMTAISQPTPDMRQAEKYFNSIYEYIHGFGGRGQRIDGIYMDYSKVQKIGKYDIIWSDFCSDPVTDDDEPELCTMQLKMDQMKDKNYAVYVHIIYRNSKFCKRK